MNFKQKYAMHIPHIQGRSSVEKHKKLAKNDEYYMEINVWNTGLSKWKIWCIDCLYRGGIVAKTHNYIIDIMCIDNMRKYRKTQNFRHIIWHIHCLHMSDWGAKSTNLCMKIYTQALADIPRARNKIYTSTASHIQCEQWMNNIKWKRK